MLGQRVSGAVLEGFRVREVLLITLESCGSGRRTIWRQDFGL